LTASTILFDSPNQSTAKYHVAKLHTEPKFKFF